MNRFLQADWADLTHAYGTAEDVPGLLTDLNSPDGATRENASYELFGNIWHQGTVYPATVKAIPILVDLLKSPDCRDPEGVAALLASIANGSGSYTVHGRYPALRSTYEKILAERGSSIAAEIEKEREYLTIIAQMAREFMPLLEPFLEATDASIRELIAQAMTRHIDAFPHYEGRVRSWLDSEPDEGAREVVAMDFNEYLVRKAILLIREVYQERFAAEVQRLRREHSEKVYTEAALRRADGEVALEGKEQLGLRVDAVIPSTGQSVSIDSATRLSFNPARVWVDDLKVWIRPFSWEHCVVTLQCESGAFQFAPIRAWFERWFDADDVKDPDERGLCGVVHFLDEPEFAKTRVFLTVDLGSAPVEAFYELLEACAQSRPRKAWVAHERRETSASADEVEEEQAR